jgi:hypothetical protein
MTRQRTWIVLLLACAVLGAAGWHYRHWLQGELGALTLPDVGPPPAGVTRFAVIGDFGAGNRDARLVARLVKSWKPDFIATLGDNNYEVGAAETIDGNIGSLYHAYIAPYRGSFGKGAEVNRFFPSIGHRDWDSPTGLQPYLDYFALPGNERYYEMRWGPVHLFMLDTDVREPDGNTAWSVQGRWLQRALAASNAPWRLVFAHHAPYVSGRVQDFEHMRWPFQAWGADAVLSGFFHVYERLSVDGLPFFVNGMGGAYISGFGEIDGNSQFRYDGMHGAMRVEADETRIRFQFVNREGRVVDMHELAKPDERARPARSGAGR